MLIKFDLEKLKSMLDDFYNISGITVSIWDAEYNQLAYRPKEMPKFCRMIKSSKLGNNLCKKSDFEICCRAFIEKKPVTHRCHAGLTDTAVPILNNGTLLGFMMFGQIMSDEHPIAAFDEIKKLCKKFEFDEKELSDAYAELNRSKEHKIISASRIIEACAGYIWYSQMIKLEYNVLSTDIDLFISDNLGKKLTIESICSNFNISKNKLYQISKQFFGDTIGNYINSKRIDMAKHYLISTEEPIYSISEKVGIPDYNYFTKIFKKYAGINPQNYRKYYPMSLEIPNSGLNKKSSKNKI